MKDFSYSNPTSKISIMEDFFSYDEDQEVEAVNRKQLTLFKGQLQQQQLHYGPANTDSFEIEFSNFGVGRGAKVAYIYH